MAEKNTATSDVKSGLPSPEFGKLVEKTAKATEKDIKEINAANRPESRRPKAPPHKT